MKPVKPPPVSMPRPVRPPYRHPFEEPILPPPPKSNWHWIWHTAVLLPFIMLFVAAIILFWRY